MPQSAATPIDAFDVFSRHLYGGGLRDALGYLLGLTDYRYIAIHRFQAGRAAAAFHFDRQAPRITAVGEAPAAATYCSLVRDSQSVFTTADALADGRLTQHVARATVRAYCGVPIMTPAGEILGTLCLYDRAPRDTEQVDLQLLCQVASELANGGHVPPYPTHPPPAPAPAAMM